MRQRPKALFTSFVLAVSLFGGAAAGPLEDGDAAYDRHDYATALQLWRPLADQGIAEAQNDIGVLYAKGQGLQQDYVNAARWFRKSADLGYPKAQHNLGVLYQAGRGVAQDPAEAGKWEKRAAAPRSIEDGNAAYTNQDYPRALQIWRPLADQGKASAQNGLGLLYENGQGVPQDYAEAARWYRKAADQGNTIARHNLEAARARSLEAGRAAYQRGNVAEAMRLLRPLADQGNARAQASLGDVFATTAPKDYTQAIIWYRKAADQGDRNGQTGLGMLYEYGNGVSQDYAEAAKWYRKAADQGDSGAQDILADMYRDGHGVTRDDALAIMWYRKAADQGAADAQNKLGGIYYSGQGVSQDYAEAVAWYRKAADQGDTDAQRRINIICSQPSAPTACAAEAQTTAKCSDQNSLFIPITCLPKTNVPFESDAVISAEINNKSEFFNTLVSIVKANDYRCDTISSIAPFVFSAGYKFSCNQYRYEYDIADKGGRWIVTVK